MDKLLEGKHALVTGGTAGIGRAIALKFAEHGAKVAIFGTNTERGASVVAEIEAVAAGSDPQFHQVDVANTAEVDVAIKQVLESFGSVEVLVNNAGITIDKLLMKMTSEDWDRVLDVNAKSCFNTCRALVRPMMRARTGKIINISSVIGLTGNVGQVNYASSKAAIIGLTKSLAKEIASRGIQVNCVAPGFIQTRMTDEMGEAQLNEVLKQIPLGRVGQPEEVANAVLFLASSMADYITGQVLTVDGGMVM